MLTDQPPHIHKSPGISLLEWADIFDKVNGVKEKTSRNDFQGDIRYHLHTVCYHISDFLKLNEDIIDFVYDRSTQYLLTNLSKDSIYHENICSILLKILDIEAYEHNNYHEDAFVIKGYGFVLSSASDTVAKGSNVKLTAQEKIVFKNFEFWDVD